MRQMVITSAMFYSSLHFAIVNSHLYSSIILKPKQVKCLEAVYFGRDVIAVLPTGYGKSLIFHLLPSLFCDKLTSASNKRAVVIVVSPLNALIENQIKKSYQGNIKAGILNVKKGKDDEDLRLNQVGTDLLLRDAMYDIYMHPRHFCLVKKGWNSFRVCLIRNQFGLLLSMKLIVFSNGMYVECEIEVHTRGEMLGLRVCKSIANPVTNSKFATICHICTRANLMQTLNLHRICIFVNL